ncbi:MAG TPA: tRNA (guanosine(37)-N1)-methyltransferase TrmD [Gemmatimonadota bacterium]|nr:tRNA (guanosine(37)-N1)-methyltransferase TrmD [Gemmatimonadota bacterium]
MHVNVLTLFPGYFVEPLEQSITGRARRKGLLSWDLIDLRSFVGDGEQVDDYPYGGGGGMVLKPEPVFRAYEALESPRPFVLLSARGRPFTHRVAVELSIEPELTFLCGHYKDVDERVRQALVTDEISLGDFVLSGGEIAALAVIDAVARLLPGVLGDFDSAQGDSYHDDWLLGPPSYTRPAEYRGMKVPEVLLSGDHAAVARWRVAEAERVTRERRPDLFALREREEERP